MWEVYFSKEVYSFVIIVDYISAYICIRIVVSRLYNSISKAYFAWKPEYPPQQISCCPIVETRGLRTEAQLRRSNESNFCDKWNPILLMSDEAHFHLNGMGNQQNSPYWDLENPRELHAKPLHNPKVTVRCAVGKAAVIGPYFFEDNYGNTVTVNSERYTKMINNDFVAELRPKRVPIQCVWFQQDGVIPHTASASMDLLLPLFGDRLVSRFIDTPWPPSVHWFVHLWLFLVSIPQGTYVWA